MDRKHWRKNRTSVAILYRPSPLYNKTGRDGDRCCGQETLEKEQNNCHITVPDPHPYTIRLEKMETGAVDRKHWRKNRTSATILYQTRQGL